jgi:hypothetical protein
LFCFLRRRNTLLATILSLTWCKNELYLFLDGFISYMDHSNGINKMDINLVKSIILEAFQKRRQDFKLLEKDWANLTFHFVYTSLTRSLSQHTPLPPTSDFLTVWSASLSLSFHHIILFRVKKNRREYVLWHITSHLLQKHSLFSPSVSRNIPLWETYALLRSITFQSFILSYFLFFLCLIIMIMEISSCFSLSVSCDPSWCEKSGLKAHNFKSIRANQESI